MRTFNPMLTNRHLQDLNPLTVGAEDCAPRHSFGPAVRPYTLLHYVVSGQGIFQPGVVTYTVGPGEVFRILPGELTLYRADRQDPWSYRWVGFDGTLSAAFASLPPVFPLPAGLVACFSPEDGGQGAAEYRVASRLFRLYAELFGTAPRRADYVQRVQDYVDAGYMTQIRVGEIAAQLHLDRRYLTRLFREKTGQTIQEYLISVRMAEAQRCLAQGLPVGETAERCGYGDVFLFSKMFKRRFGVSPANWKKARPS